MLIDLLSKCLVQAHNNKMASIAFSAIGTGTLQFPRDVVARFYFDQTIDFSKKHPNTTLKDIKFVPFDKDTKTVRVFKDELSRRKPQATAGKSSLEASKRQPTSREGSSASSTSALSALRTSTRQALTKVSSAMAKPFHGRQKEISSTESSTETPPATGVALEVFACRQGDLKDAINSINDMMNEQCKPRFLSNDAIKILSVEQIRRIHDEGLRHDTKVQIDTEKSSIQISGLSEDVSAVSEQIHGIFIEVKEEAHKRDRAELLARDVEWQYKDDEVFKKYANDINAKIELAYFEEKAEVSFFHGDDEYLINFAARTETNLGTGDVTDVRRRDHRKGNLLSLGYQPTDGKPRAKETINVSGI